MKVLAMMILLALVLSGCKEETATAPNPGSGGGGGGGGGGGIYTENQYQTYGVIRYDAGHDAGHDAGYDAGKIDILGPQGNYNFSGNTDLGINKASRLDRAALKGVTYDFVVPETIPVTSGTSEIGRFAQLIIESQLNGVSISVRCKYLIGGRDGLDTSGNFIYVGSDDKFCTVTGDTPSTFTSDAITLGTETLRTGNRMSNEGICYANRYKTAATCTADASNIIGAIGVVDSLGGTWKDFGGGLGACEDTLETARGAGNCLYPNTTGHQWDGKLKPELRPSVGSTVSASALVELFIWNRIEATRVAGICVDNATHNGDFYACKQATGKCYARSSTSVSGTNLDVKFKSKTDCLESGFCIASGTVNNMNTRSSCEDQGSLWTQNVWKTSVFTLGAVTNTPTLCSGATCGQPITYNLDLVRINHPLAPIP